MGASAWSARWACSGDVHARATASSRTSGITFAEHVPAAGHTTTFVVRTARDPFDELVHCRSASTATCVADIDRRGSTIVLRPQRLPVRRRGRSGRSRPDEAAEESPSEPPRRSVRRLRRRCAAVRPRPSDATARRPAVRRRCAMAHRREPADAGVRRPTTCCRRSTRPGSPQAVKPKQFLHIDQAECILCEGCVDICPWKCIHMVSVDAIDEAVNTEQPGDDPSDHVVVHRRRRRLHPLRAVRRPLPDRRHHPRQGHRPTCADGDPTSAPTDTATPTASGSEAAEEIEADRFVANGNGEQRAAAARRSARALARRRRQGPRLAGVERRSSGPGSIFRKGYTDSPRNRSYVIMNNVLYHLHPVKVKRHAVKVSATRSASAACRFFLFILLTVTGIFLMFFYRPTAAPAWDDVQHARDRGDVRLARAQHAPMGRAPHGALRLPAHGARLLPRRLQAAARVQLGDRRHPAARSRCCSRSPATCCRGTSSRSGPSRSART